MQGGDGPLRTGVWCRLLHSASVTPAALSAGGKEQARAQGGGTSAHSGAQSRLKKADLRAATGASIVKDRRLRMGKYCNCTVLVMPSWG